MQTRTRKQALTHILAEHDARRLGATMKNPFGPGTTCLYESKNGQRHCGVGCLFSPEQIKWLKDKGLNEKPIVHVASEVGIQNLFAVTGMHLHELQLLQTKHDGERQAVKKGQKNTNLRWYLKQELKTA